MKWRKRNSPFVIKINKYQSKAKGAETAWRMSSAESPSKMGQDVKSPVELGPQ